LSIYETLFDLGEKIERRDELASVMEGPSFWGDQEKAKSDTANPPGTIPGDLAVAAILSTAWQALHDSLVAIARFAANPAAPESSESESESGPDEAAQSEESA